MTGRAEKVRLAQEMRASGLSVTRIAAEMDVAFQTASGWLNDPDLAKQKARRARYAGTCETCGAATDGSSGPGKAPRFCIRHQFDDLERRERMTLWTRERIIEAIRWWNDTYGEPPAMTDWNPWQAEHKTHDPERSERGHRLIDAHRVPWFTHVVTRFGSWNAAIEAAGFAPRQADGGGENALLQRLGHVQADILDALYQTNGDGLRQKDIMVRVEASLPSVRSALLSLRRRGYIERIGYGRYRAKAAA